MNIVVAAGAPSRRTQLNQKIRTYLPETSIFLADNLETLEHVLHTERPRNVVIHTDFCQEDAAPDQVTEFIRKCDPTIHLLWIIPQKESGAEWLKRAETYDFDIAVAPVNGLEIAQRCRSASADSARLHLANHQLTKLVTQRSERLYESDERFRQVFNACSDGILVFDVEQGDAPFTITEVNNQLCHLLAYPRNEFMELQPKDIFESHRVKYVESRFKALQIYRHLFFESILMSRDGQQIPALLSARLYNYSDQAYVILLVRIREGVLHSHATPSGNSPSDRPSARGQIDYVLTPESGEIHVCGDMLGMTGLSQAQIEGLGRRSLLHAIHPDDRPAVLSGLAQTMENLTSYQRRFRIYHASGKFRHVEDEGIVLPDESGRPARLLGTVRDVTEQVQSDNVEQQAEQALQHSKRLESLGVLAGGIAHDFNNILAAIIGLTDMSIQAFTDGTPDIDEILEDLRESLGAAHRAKDLVKQILAFSRQSGEEHEPLVLHVIAHEVLSLLRASVPSSIRVVDSIDPQSGMVMANPTQMHQVIMNYCTNGLQAMAERDGILEVRLEDVDVTRRFAATNPKLRPGPYVKLTVSDRGHGMTPSVARRIFDPFFTTKGPGEGAGMGLAMVYGIVADHGGAVLVDSVLGQGTVFSTYLPRVDAVAHRDKKRGASLPRGTERILVIDDEQPVRRFCERALTQLGYTVHSAGHPADALAFIKADPNAYDIIMTDHHLPDMSGVNLARRILKIRPDLPVILFTGFSQNVDGADIQKAGIREVVAKPVIISQLAETLRRVLDGAAPTG